MHFNLWVLKVVEKLPFTYSQNTPLLTGFLFLKEDEKYVSLDTLHPKFAFGAIGARVFIVLKVIENVFHL